MPKGSLTIKKMPINAPPYSDVPEVALSTLSAQLINGFIYPLKEDEKYLTMNRPGLQSTAFCDLSLGYPVDGLWWWPSKKYVLATCAGQLFKIDSTGTPTQISGVPVPTGRANFCQVGIGGPYAFIASGGPLTYTDGETVMFPQGLGVPTNSTHVTYMDNYIIANEEGTNQFKWSEPGQITSDLVTGTDSKVYMCILPHVAAAANQPITGSSWGDYWELSTGTGKTWASGTHYFAGWPGLNLANLEAKGDVLMALDSRFDQIILFGKNSIEYWYNDGVSPFSKFEGTTSEVGTIAIYSVIFDGNIHWMLDADRNLIKMINRAPNVVSNPFASLLQDMGTVDDCFSTAIKCDGQNFLVLTFPTANITLVYDVKNDGWQGQWGTWDAGKAAFDRWLVNSYCKCPEWRFDLTGDRRSGKIYKISRQYASDAEFPLRIVKRTGWNDYGIKYMKRSNRIRISLQRGKGLSDLSQEPLFTMRSRKDGNMVWEDERIGSLGKQGDTSPIVEFRQNGIFRSRQDEYSFYDAVPLTIIDGEEDIEILSR